MRTSFRHLAPFLWKDAFDPSTYGEVDLDLSFVERFQEKNNVSLRSILLKALAEGYSAVPQVNSLVRWGRVRPRSFFAMSLMVPHENEDLCFLTFHELHKKTILQIDSELKDQLQKLRHHDGVASFKTTMTLIKNLPRFLFVFLVPVLRWLLRIDLFKIPFVPRRPFGALVVSNVGTLGFHRGLLPLVPLTDASVMVALGLVEKRPMVVDDKVVIHSGVTIGFNLDHRIMDGFHAARFIAAFKEVFMNPEKYL